MREESRNRNDGRGKRGGERGRGWGMGEEGKKGAMMHLMLMFPLSPKTRFVDNILENLIWMKTNMVRLGVPFNNSITVTQTNDPTTIIGGVRKKRRKRNTKNELAIKTKKKKEKDKEKKNKERKQEKNRRGNIPKGNK